MNFIQEMYYYEIMNSESDFAKRLLEIIREEGYSVEQDNLRAKEMYSEFLKRFPNLSDRFRNSHSLTTEFPFFSMEFERDGQRVRMKDLIYQFLQEKGYNTNNLVKGFIRRIAKYDDLQEDSYSLYSDQKAYDIVIENVSFSEDGLVTVETKTGEIFSFYQADKYFPEDSELGQYIKENHGENNCHDYTENLQKFLPDSVSVTAQLARDFDENYYMHSYVELNENQVLDLTFNIVMDKKQFESLMQPKKKCFSGKNKDMKEKMESLDDLLLLDGMGETFLKIRYFDMLKLSAFETLKERDPKIVSLYEEKLSQPT